MSSRFWSRSGYPFRLHSDCVEERSPSGARITEDMMRIMTLAVAAVLAVSLAGPASAAKRKGAPPTASFQKGERLAIVRGVRDGETGHTEFEQRSQGRRPNGPPPGEHDPARF